MGRKTGQTTSYKARPPRITILPSLLDSFSQPTKLAPEIAAAEAGAVVKLKMSSTKKMATKSEIESATFAGMSASAYSTASREKGSAQRKWRTAHTLFCDESGNSGNRWYHPEQPIYAEGGWIVPHSARREIMDVIQALEVENGYTAKTKGTALKSSHRGRKYICHVFEAIRKHAAPFIFLVEKRYFVCSKIVESYFDPVYNPSVDPKETWDPEKRQERAEMFYRGPDEYIEQFARAFRTNDHDMFAPLGGAWADFFGSRGQGVFANGLRDGLSEIGENLRREGESIKAQAVPNGFDSLNMPVLAQVFQLIEQNFPPCELVHDKCASLEAVYNHVFKMQRNAAPVEFTLKDGSTEIFGFQNLNSLTFADSEKQPIIRAADYLTASCVDFARMSFEQKPVSEELAEAAFPGIGGIFAWVAAHVSNPETDHPQFGQIIGSDIFKERVLLRMREHFDRL